MPYVNCTNHEITVEIDDLLVIMPPSGNVARMVLRQELVEIIDSIPVYNAIPPTEVKGLPDPLPNVIYITSAHVAQFAGRPDVVCPNNAPDQCSRDSSGKVTAVKSFLRYYHG